MTLEKFLEAIIESLRDFAKAKMPIVTRIFDQVFSLRDTLLTYLSLLLRRSGDRGILAVSLLASFWAVFLFISTVSTPGAPKPSHDAILKARFSSPAASSNLIILDIDERSIASLSESQGRWPWPREVLADGLQKLEELEVTAVAFNVLLSEPDKQNPESDAAMEIASALFRPAGFPLVRLDKSNDSSSQLRVADIPGSQVEPGSEDIRLSAILPLFPSMHDRLGITNQRPDGDGIIRKYPFRWAEAGFKIPSILEVTLSAAGEDTADIPNLFAINWRNKRGSYQRISFSDLYLDKLTSEEKARLKGAIVVLGVSAPGVGQTKATGIAAVVDDSEILVTALDDALNKSYLRLPPAWLLLCLNLISIWILYLVFAHKSANAAPINRIFAILQAALGAVTLLSASYTFYLVDLTDSMQLALGVFGAIKLVQGFDARWSRAKKGYRRLRNSVTGSRVVIASFFEESLKDRSESDLQRDLEKILSYDRVIRIDDLIGGESFLKSSLSKSRLLLLCTQSEQEETAVNSMLHSVGLAPSYVDSFPLEQPWNPDDKAFIAAIGPLVIASISGLLSLPKD